MFQPYEVDMSWLEQQFGRKTINQIRKEAGIKAVEGGEMAYVDYIKRELGYPLKPTLKILRRPQEESGKETK